MGLFDLKIGNKNIDRSITIRENINNTILENITNSSYAVKSSATSNQKIEVDCTPAYQAMLEAYKLNPIWGKPPSVSEFAEACTLINASMKSDINLNINSSNVTQFGSELENNIKRDFQQMEESTKDKNWVELGAFNQNVNEATNIKKLIDNVKRSNIKNIVNETITNAKIEQSIKVGLGNITGAEMNSKITLIVSAISNSIVKDIDKTFLDTKVSQLEKKEERDSITGTIGNMFNNVTDFIKTGMSSTLMIIGICILALVFVFIKAPHLFCVIPGANIFLASICNKKNNSYDNSNDNSQLYNYGQQMPYYQQPMPYYAQPISYYQQPIPNYNNPIIKPSDNQRIYYINEKEGY